MGEQTSKTSQNTSAYAASSDRAAKAYAAIIAIAADAATGSLGAIADFRRWAEAAGVELRAGGWTYSTVAAPHSTALAQGWKRLALRIADRQYGGVARAMAERYERSLPADPESAPKVAKRKLDGYYGVDELPRPLDIVQLPGNAIGVVEHLSPGGEVLVRTNRDMTPGSLETYPVSELRAVPPVAYEQTGVPGAVSARNVPRDFARSELSQRAIMRARRVAPDARLTSMAVKVDNRYEYGRAFVYAIASIIDAARLMDAPVGDRPGVEPVRNPFTVVDEATAIRSEAHAIIDRLALAATPARSTDPATDDDVDEIVERLVRRAQYLALRKVLDVVEGWREGARSNHDANGHRNEVPGYDCWEQWHSSDIRTMVADAARELHTADPNDGHAIPDLPAPS